MSVSRETASHANVVPNFALSVKVWQCVGTASRLCPGERGGRKVETIYTGEMAIPLSGPCQHCVMHYSEGYVKAHLVDSSWQEPMSTDEKRGKAIKSI